MYSVLLLISLMIVSVSASSNLNSGDIPPNAKVLNIGYPWNGKPWTITYKESQEMEHQKDALLTTDNKDSDK